MASAEASSRAAPRAEVPARTRVAACAVLIPAYDEERTVARVVATARAAGLGQVVVVDDGSRDATAARARAAGADVLRLEHNGGKGGAVVAGARATLARVLVLLDADLTGLQPAHLRALAAPVLDDRADMTRGVFTGGRFRTATAQRLTPQLNGQRAVLRERLLALPALEASRFGLETILTEAARRQGWRRLDVPMRGVSQVMKEEKRGVWRGVWTRLAMYRDILRALWPGRR